MKSFESLLVSFFLRESSTQPGLRVCKRKASALAASYRRYEDIPSRKGVLPAALDLWRSGGPGYLHEHCDRRHAELGPIFRERLGSAELVFIADTRMIQTVIANEGPRPHHNVPEAWTVYNQTKNIDRGLFFQIGEPWIKLRRAFNKIMLTNSEKITRFTSEILKINSDLFCSWQESNKLQELDRSFVVKDVKFELCKWSIEATGLMLFGCRTGCITSHGRESDNFRAEKLVNHVANMFAETSNFQIIPCRLAHRLNLGTWRRFEAACEGMLELANEYADEYMAQAKRSDHNQSLLKDLLNLNALSDSEISRSMVDLIIAAADTTSNSLQWMLYCLAKYPKIQATIRDEVQSIEGNLASFQEIKKSCHYLCAFVKEVSRLYPTAPFLARTLDHEISLDDYILPAGVPIVFSLYTTSRSEVYFEEPLAFKPERWLRNEAESPCKSSTKTPSHAYASLPFGVGARMCIGRRLADLEMHLLIASFVLKFSASLADDKEIGIRLKMILSPDKPIKLRLHPLVD